MITLRLIVLVLSNWCLLSGAALADSAADDKDAKDLRTWNWIQQGVETPWFAILDQTVVEAFAESPLTSFAEIEEFYVKLAAIGHPEGAHAVGLMYNYGLGSFPKDSCLAVLWHYDAAASNPASSINVGLSYLRGIGLRPDLHNAYRWVSQGLEFSDEPFAVPEWDLLIAQIPEDRRLVLDVELRSPTQEFYFDFDPIILPDILWDSSVYPEAAKLLVDEGLVRCDF